MHDEQDSCPECRKADILSDYHKLLVYAVDLEITLLFTRKPDAQKEYDEVMGKLHIMHELLTEMGVNVGVSRFA